MVTHLFLAVTLLVSTTQAHAQMKCQGEVIKVLSIYGQGANKSALESMKQNQKFSASYDGTEKMEVAIQSGLITMKHIETPDRKPAFNNMIASIDSRNCKLAKLTFNNGSGTVSVSSDQCYQVRELYRTTAGQEHSYGSGGPADARFMNEVLSGKERNFKITPAIVVKARVKTKMVSGDDQRALLKKISDNCINSKPLGILAISADAKNNVNSDYRSNESAPSSKSARSAAGQD